MKKVNKAPGVVKYICDLINFKNKSKAFIIYRKTDHPLSTGWLIKNKSKELDSCIFYSKLSLDFYFYSIKDKEIYTYQEKDGIKKHINNFFNNEETKTIEKYLLTL